MIEVKNLVKRYGNHTAVDHLSFTVDTGKVVGFLGPNGAGKSTTMNIITGYIAQTEGTVLIDGIDMLEEPQRAKKKIGYLPEIPPLYPDLLVREYLEFVAALRKTGRKDRDMELYQIMKKTKVLDVSERLIRHLSKGYRQRVGLAAALIGKPDILILDEPTVGLDPGQIIEIRELIRELSKDHTVLLSSHIMQEISAVCDEIIIINKGKMIACDTPENLTERMLTNNGTHLLIKGAADKVRDTLNQMAEVKELVEDEKPEMLGEEKLFGATVYTDRDVDAREQIFYAMAEISCPIIEMHHLDTSLEDAFLALTSGEGSLTENAVIEETSDETGASEEDSAESGEATEDVDEAKEAAAEEDAGIQNGSDAGETENEKEAE